MPESIQKGSSGYSPFGREADVNDHLALDQFWKKQVALELTEDEVSTVDRCLYDIPNFDNEPLPQIRHKFWPKQPGIAAHLIDSLDTLLM